jgi:hypothetical protein
MIATEKFEGIDYHDKRWGQYKPIHAIAIKQLFLPWLYVHIESIHGVRHGCHGIFGVAILAIARSTFFDALHHQF